MQGGLPANYWAKPPSPPRMTTCPIALLQFQGLQPYADDRDPVLFRYFSFRRADDPAVYISGLCCVAALLPGHLAERLGSGSLKSAFRIRRRPRNPLPRDVGRCKPLGNSRVGSNPAVVDVSKPKRTCKSAWVPFDKSYSRLLHTPEVENWLTRLEHFLQLAAAVPSAFSSQNFRAGRSIPGRGAGAKCVSGRIEGP